MHGLLVKGFQRLLGELAGAVARQNVEQAQWTGQENGINALAQRRQQILRRQPGRNDESRQTHDMLSGAPAGR